MSNRDQLAAKIIERRLATGYLGRRIIYLASTHSTNDVAKEAARAGAPEGTLVIAEEQTAGRGRLGRTWLSPAGSSLLMSLVMRPPLPPAAVFGLTMLASTAVAAAVESISGGRADVKWPNDVLVGGRKIAGILSEIDLVEDSIRFVVVGIGLNVNADLSLFDEIASTATSLSSELGRPVNRVEVLGQVVQEFESRYYPLLNLVGSVSFDEWHDGILREWRSRLITLGQPVTVDDGQMVYRGLAEDVDSDGTLLLRQADGSTIRVTTGDVTLREPRG